MFVVKYKKIFFTLTALLIAFSLFSIFYYGLQFGIDFTGGSILEVSYQDPRPSQESIKTALDSQNLGAYSLRPSGDKNYILRSRTLSPEEKDKVVVEFSQNGSLKLSVERFNTIGPVVGEELRNKAFVAIAVVILAIVIFITFAFRKVSEPVSSWKFGVATILALVHDVIVPTGIFVAWTHFRGGELDLLFVTALLAILGYSVHDTIVVFDRVRENLRVNRERHVREEFETTVGKSVSQTFGRSINTSLTIFLVLAALYFLGGETTRDFAFVLLVGVIAGTYSSIFLANPLLVWFAKRQKKS